VKGAENVIGKYLRGKKSEVSDELANNLATEGLRTLVVAQKILVDSKEGASDGRRAERRAS